MISDCNCSSYQCGCSYSMYKYNGLNCNTCNPCQNIYIVCNQCINKDGFNLPCTTYCKNTDVYSQCRPSSTNIIYVTGSSGITVPNGGIPIPVGSSIVPSNTVTVVTNYISTPISDIGGIILDNSTGRFTVPTSGYYFISGTLCFVTDVKSVMFIYKVNAGTGFIELLACSNITNNIYMNPNTFANLSGFLTLTGVGTNSSGQVCTTVSTNTYLNANDQIFFAIIQSSGLAVTTTANNRFIIYRLNNQC